MQSLRKFIILEKGGKPAFMTVINIIDVMTYKNKIADKLEKSIDVFKTWPYIQEFYQNQITNLRKDVFDLEKQKHLQKAFIRYNDAQDRHRKGKTWRELLPDLEKVLTQSLTQCKI